jgi:hypothetical protein
MSNNNTLTVFGRRKFESIYGLFLGENFTDFARIQDENDDIYYRIHTSLSRVRRE